MAARRTQVAIVYDFDGTLAPGNMQERDFIPAIGANKEAFWKEVKAETERSEADQILTYMRLMLEKAQVKHVQVRKSNFKDFGRQLELFPGILSYIDEKGQTQGGWFERINRYASESAIKLSHFVVSSGIREMIEGTKIFKEFEAVYASSFVYDHHGVAIWPALALNFTTKTQYLFRINKGSLHVYDDSIINKYVPHDQRPVPFTNMIFIGDGETDIPCFRLVTEQNGHSIAVYKPNTKRSKADKYLKEGRVAFIAPADYRDSRPLDKIVKAILDKIQVDTHLGKFRSDRPTGRR